MATVIKISEYSQSHPIDLSVFERNLISQRCDKKLGIIRPLEGDGYCVTSSSYVGVYCIDRYEIHVESKIPVISIFKMLCYAYDLAFFDESCSKFENINELFEYLISIFQKKLARLAKSGLFANYIEKNDDLNYVRGNINIRNLLNRCWQKNIINCNFDEFHTDVIENQIIKYTLEKTLKLNFHNAEILRQIKIVKRYFNAISFQLYTTNDILNVQYTVLNSHYKSIHDFCRMILELVGIHEREGLEKFNAYSINMNLLFERFIGRLLKEKLYDYNVSLQDFQHLDEEGEIEIKPDIVIYDKGVPRLVMDTKYKIDKKSSSSDIMQLNAYMDKLKIDGVLIYPAFEIHEKIHTLEGKKLFIKTINLENLDRGIDEFMEWVIKRF